MVDILLHLPEDHKIAGGKYKPGQHVPALAKPPSRVELETAGLQNQRDAVATDDTLTTCDTRANSLSPDLSLALENHPELLDLIAAWPTLSESIRGAILAMVPGAKP